ncbi:hypothetical protein ACFT2C_19590 [Promicromonospora sp. NPDC057138]
MDPTTNEPSPQLDLALAQITRVPASRVSETPSRSRGRFTPPERSGVS